MSTQLTPPSLIHSIRLTPRAAWVLYAATFINRFGSFVAVFMALYLTSRGYTPAQAGLAVAAFGLGSVPGSLASGYLADRIGRRETLMVSSCLGATFSVAIAFADGLPLLILLSGLAGLANQMYPPPAFAMLADLIPRERRMAAVGIMRFAINGGFAAGPAVAGLLADHTFRLVFIADAAASLVIGVIACFWLPAGRPDRASPTIRGEGASAVLHDRVFLQFLVAAILVAAVYAQGSTTFPLWVRAHGYSNATYGALMGLNGTTIVVLELIFISVLQRFQPRAVILAGYLLIGAGFAGTLAASTLPLLALVVFVWTAGEMTAFPTSSVLVADLSPTHLRGRYQGTWSLGWAIGWTLGPAAGSWLYERSPTALWLACGVVGAVGAVLVGCLPDRRARPPESVGTGPR